MGLKDVGLSKTEGMREFWNLEDIFFVCYDCEKLALASHFHVSFLVGFIYEFNKYLSLYTARFSDILAYFPCDAESL